MTIQRSLFPAEVLKENNLACRAEWMISPLAHKLALLMARKYQEMSKQKPLEKFEYLKFHELEIAGAYAGGEDYKKVRNMFEAIRNAAVILYYPEAGVYEQVSVFAGRSYYNTKTHEVSACFNQGMVDVFIKLGEYSRLMVTEMLALPNTKYSRLVYQYFKSYEFKKQVVLDINEVKKATGGKQYVKWADYERRVLKPAWKEITENTSLHFDYVPVKGEKSKVISLRVWYSKK